MRMAINTDIIIFTVSIPYRYTAREELTFMKILFYGTKNYDEEFFEKLLPSYPGITIKFTGSFPSDPNSTPFLTTNKDKDNLFTPRSGAAWGIAMWGPIT